MPDLDTDVSKWQGIYQIAGTVGVTMGTAAAAFIGWLASRKKPTAVDHEFHRYEMEEERRRLEDERRRAYLETADAVRRIKEDLGIVIEAVRKSIDERVRLMEIQAARMMSVLESVQDTQNGMRVEQGKLRSELQALYDDRPRPR